MALLRVSKERGRMLLENLVGDNTRNGMLVYLTHIRSQGDLTNLFP